MEALLIKRRTLKGKITRASNNLDKLLQETPLSQPAVEVQTDRVNLLTIECDQLEGEIAAYCDDDEAAENEQEFNILTDKLNDLSIKLKSVKTVQQIPVSSNQQSGSSSNTSYVKLPTLSLPTFSGNITEWLSFHDLYVASVHNLTKLTGAQKFQYLRSVLKDEPAKLIQSIPVTDNNYIGAWDIVLNRYQNKRENIFAHLKRLFSQPIGLPESAANLRKLHDTTLECVRALKVLGCQTDNWDELLVFFVTERLDKESRCQWELTLERDDLPTFQELCKFVEKRASALATKDTSLKAKPSTSSVGNKQSTTTSSHYTQETSCILCGGNHPLGHKCDTFHKLTVDQRWKKIKEFNLCNNCLRKYSKGHSCSDKKCFKCERPHHTLLHQERKNEKPEKQAANQTPTETTLQTHYSSDSRRNVQVLLSTILVKIRPAKGQDLIFRALLDQGSQSSFISEDCYQKLGYKQKRANVTLTGLSQNNVGSSHGSLNFTITSLTKNYATDVEALILKKVTGTLPNNNIDISKWSHIEGLPLADPKFNVPGKVDILLGADICAEIMIGTKLIGPEGSAMAFHTHFGWVLYGNVEEPNPKATVKVYHTQCDLDSTLKKFWEVEELPSTPLLTPEEKKCERHFQETHNRDPSGRYVVKLPFKEDACPLGESYNMAIKRFTSIERRLATNHDNRELYVNFMNTYLSLGHMELISEELISKTHNNVVPYYIPHHFVLKPYASTSKFRVVFDASAKTSSGASLNSNLMVGPKLQDDLTPLLLRFRTNAIALTADISKMYRQILVDKSQQDYQRIVWRESPDRPIQTFRLKTVTYGTASAPYLATKCLQQLSYDEGQQLPLASKILRQDFYVDDLLTGAPTPVEAIELRAGISQITDAGHLPLLKWSSNNLSVLETIPPELRANQSPLTFDVDDTHKILGISWNPGTDEFFFVVNPPTPHLTMTKRTLLSDLAKTFDPLGWLSPITIKAKIIMQQLWTLPLTWDDPLPDHIIHEWQQYCDELPVISNIRIPRYVLHNPIAEHSLHGFCDASQSAYSAVVYVRSILPDQKPTVTIVMAKTKVAPIKSVSLPRLELCGSVILARLITLIIKSFNVEFKEVHAWTDSTLVLDWLGSYPNRWKTFVANRASEIQNLLSPSHWHYIKGVENPADCASRGISPAQLRNHPLWWHGPPWLSEPEFEIPLRNLTKVTDLEAKTTKVEVHVTLCEDLTQKFSSLTKLKRVTAYCLRFIRNCQLKQDQRILGPLSQQEIQLAFIKLVKSIQYSAFPDEHKALIKNKPLHHKSKLRFVDPFLDKDGVFRVGGRLKFANIPEDTKHPLLLPRQHPLTQLVVSHYHLSNLHAGPQLTLAAARQQFWILCGRDVVHHFVRRCVTCHRHRPRPEAQKMANLPRSRVNPSAAFVITGVDYAGPITMRFNRGRGQKRCKGYIALFVCFATRAIHLEAVSDLTTEAFIAALKRFVARRGKPSDIHSDNGTNFVGADRELQEVLELVTSPVHNTTVTQFLSEEGVNWHLNPPSAPHFGGLWEAGVKSVKHHLKRIMGNADLTYEELQTSLAQIESCVNSRPLTPMSNDPNDLTVLTPGHFLIGRPLTAIVEPDYILEKVNRLNRWQLTQQLMQHFWRRWSSEFLAQLQHRPKWHSTSPNLKVGTLVLIKDEKLPPLKWQMGRIISLHPGEDNLVRAVTLKTSVGELKRPIVKVCPLPID